MCKSEPVTLLYCGLPADDATLGKRRIIDKRGRAGIDIKFYPIVLRRTLISGWRYLNIIALSPKVRTLKYMGGRSE